jgi:aminopeptidase N
MQTVDRLINQLVPKHYNINLDLILSGKARNFSGQIELLGELPKPTDHVRLHAKGLEISQATINGQSATVDYDTGLGEVTLNVDKDIVAGNVEVSLHFAGKVTDAMHGLYPCYFEHEGKKKVLIATQFESHYAREVFPCVDEPEAKATFDLTLTTLPGVTVLGNMPIKKHHSEQTQQTTTFETTPRMSAYLLAFVVGELHKKTAHTRDGVEVNVWATPVQKSDSLDFALKTAVGSIEFFNDYFGMPYPLPKSDHVALPDFSNGAMENWGLITYREICLLVDPKHTAQTTKEYVALVIAHETSHQWFGNLVTMRWWDDLWLNESFATLMEYLAVDSLYPDWDIWTTFGNQEAFGAFRRDALPGVQAVRTEVHHPDEISTLFDSAIVYAKGARLLYMLHSFVGEHAFRAGLGDYFTKHAYGNTVGDDLWAALSGASDKDISGFIRPWLEQSGYPFVTVSQKDKQLELTQNQFLFTPEDEEPNHKLWPVPLLATGETESELLTMREVTLGLKSEDYIRLNSHGAGHYIVRYAEKAHRESIKSEIASGDLSATDRMFLLNDSSLLAKAGFTSITETLDMLPSYSSETSEPVWDTIASLIGSVKHIVEDSESTEKLFKSYVGTLITSQYQRLGWNELSGESSSDTKLRATILGLGVYAEVPEIIAEAKKRYAAAKKLTDLPGELRGIILSAAVRHEHPGAFDKLQEAYKTTNDADLQQDITSGLTSTRRPEQYQALIAQLTDGDLIRKQDVARWFVGLMRNRYAREDSWNWMVDKWPWIEEHFGQDKTYDSFPRYTAMILGTEKWHARYREFFEPLMSHPALKRTIKIGLTDIATQAEWTKRDLPKVQAFLQEIKARQTVKI